MLLGLHVQADSLSIVSYLLQERDCFRLEQTFSSVTCRSRPPFLRPNESSHRPTGRNSQVATASFLKIILGYSLGGCFFFYCVPISMGRRMWKLPESLENGGRTSNDRWKQDTRIPARCHVARLDQTAKRGESKDTTNGSVGSAWNVDPATWVCARARGPPRGTSTCVFLLSPISDISHRRTTRRRGSLFGFN